MSGRGKGLRFYSMDQCALYKVGSFGRLSVILEIEEKDLKALIHKDLSYREFSLLEEVNPFSGKKTKARTVQEPFGDLKKIHERILSLLKRISPPTYAHAAVRGKSYRSNADAHKAFPATATFDLKNFYGSTRAHLVYYFFRDRLKCAPDVAGVLTKLVTIHGVLPTGSTLSPLLSLYAAGPMLDELEILSHSCGLKFTCYIDDLTFSGNTIPEALGPMVQSVVGKYGYALSDKKTRYFGKGMPKHITGVVVQDGKLHPPFSRFRTARNLFGAIHGSKPNHGLGQIKLYEKLAGLLGETAFLDPEFKRWADAVQIELNNLRAESARRKIRRMAVKTDSANA